jgi:adenylate cyclase
LVLAREQRRLAAIVAADVVGYSRLMGRDESGTLTTLKALRQEVVDPPIAAHGGRIVKTTGDGLLLEFPSVVDAVRCVMEVQTAMAERGAAVPEGRRLSFRIGINIGDIIIDGEDIFGDGVNVAARLQEIAEPGGMAISSRVHEDVRDRLDLVFGDAGALALKNISRPVHVWRWSPGATVPTTGPPLALPDKPSIAVLPFQNMSGDPEQDYFADGMVEEITTALSHIRWLFVIARNSSFTYKGGATDIKQVGRELGVRYVLEGSVRKGGDRLRITAQLIDATNGSHLWADRFDGTLEHVFELQDTVATSVAGVIEPALQGAEMQRSARRPTADLTAYDLYLRAAAALMHWDKPGLLRALDLLGQALERDPLYGSALSSVATCYMQSHLNGWSEDQEQDRSQGLDYARRALRAAVDDPRVLGDVAYVLGYFERDINPAIDFIDRSLELNPSSAIGWTRSGWLRLWNGQHELAIKHFETSSRLNPRRRHPALFGIAASHFFARRLEEAAAMFLLSVEQSPNWAPGHRFLASCYAHMGRLDEAHDIINTLGKITPVIIPGAEHWRIPKDREFFLAGLRLAAQ